MKENLDFLRAEFDMYEATLHAVCPSQKSCETCCVKWLCELSLRTFEKICNLELVETA